MKFLLFSALSLLLVPSLGTAAIYEIDPAHSNVGFEVTHLGISKVPGSFKEYKGTFDFDEKSQTLKNLKVEIQTASIDTGNSDRDKHLKSADFFDAAKYPTATFSVKAPTKISGGNVMGDLTIRGKTEHVPVKIAFNGTAAAMGTTKSSFDAETTIDRRKFGMTWNKEVDAAKKPGLVESTTNKAKDLAVSNEVAITVNVEANQKK